MVRVGVGVEAEPGGSGGKTVGRKSPGTPIAIPPAIRRRTPSQIKRPGIALPEPTR